MAEADQLISLTYSIIDGNEQDLFVIGESSGAIITQHPVDREQMDKHLLKIHVRAKEKLVSAVCLAEVVVLDVNDNRPRVLNSGTLCSVFIRRQGSSFWNRVWLDLGAVDHSALTFW